MHPTPEAPHDIRRVDLTLPPSLGLHATRLLGLALESGPEGLIYVAEDERRAERICRAIQGLAPHLNVMLLPPWDCLPYDSASPSCEVMGQRASVLRRLQEKSGEGPCVLITSPAAIVQRVPPRSTWSKATFRLKAGESFSQAALESYLLRTGYVLDERVDEPGEAAIRGQVIDLFPANQTAPFRAEYDGGAIVAIRRYDPVSQRTEAEVDTLVLEPASEVIGGENGEPIERSTGHEHGLAAFYPTLETVMDYWPDAPLAIETRAEDRRQLVLEQVADAFESRTSLGGRSEASQAPERLFMSEDEWQAALSRRRVTFIHPLSDEEASASAVPRFASAAQPGRALTDFVKAQRASGRKIVFAAATRQDLGRMKQRARGLQLDAEPAENWQQVADGSGAGWYLLRADLGKGFIDEREEIAVVTAGDLLGSRAAKGHAQPDQSAAQPFAEAGFQIGDAVIHVDHGLGVLESIESVDLGDLGTGDAIRLRYAADAKLMVPVTEMDRIWRLGTSAEGVSLDKLNGEAWHTRRAKIEGEIREAAGQLADLVKAREATSLEPIKPSGRDYERFAARFPFGETPDQLRAIEEVLDDLASGRPMDRLVCGDVGFGKTEVALRAAAAVALSGKQVAIVAPTTVLARQHFRTFQRRFAGLGVNVAHLSRLVQPSEAKAVKKGLSDGTIRIVIGTHALTGNGVAFKDLALVVIDEEQRFGVAQKAKLRALAAGGHVLTLTATPIPRTLQAALVGLQDISIIATPPARRQPIRTVLTAFDPASAREALMRERRRGGQSFVVCSRVEDIEPMRDQLAKIVPELRVMAAHGQMPPAETDEAMVRFADGDGDILLATNIIESGLDVPRANTMLVWRADRFGLSQLHQLRGRVGRGRVRGTAYLLTEPERQLPKATEKRLRTLEALDRLGAGFAISAKDLDQRGAGALLGDEQAGHVKLVGPDLYQHMLKRALRGEALDDDWTPEFNLGLTGMVPEDYVSEPEVRIDLYARLARPELDETVDDLSSEVEDRFGPMPEPVRNLLELTRMKQLCLTHGIARIDAGPKAIAMTFRNGAPSLPSVQKMVENSSDELKWSGDRLVSAKSSEHPQDRLKLVLDLLDHIG